MSFQYLIKPFSENAEQQATVNYIKTRHPNVLFTTGLLGIRLPKWALWLLNALGYRSGTPDIHIYEPRRFYNGLFIEMKRPRRVYVENGVRKISPAGSLSKEQINFLAELNKRGYKAIVCFSYEEATRAIDEYLRG